MPYAQYATYPSTATSAQASLNVDPSTGPFNASVAVLFGTGATATCTLQACFDNFDSPAMVDSSATWFNISASITTSSFTTLNNPVTRIRLNITSLSGGTLTLAILQGMSKN